jgi:hypothetical protein
MIQDCSSLCCLQSAFRLFIKTPESSESFLAKRYLAAELLRLSQQLDVFFQIQDLLLYFLWNRRPRYIDSGSPEEFYEERDSLK